MLDNSPNLFIPLFEKSLNLMYQAIKMSITVDVSGNLSSGNSPNGFVFFFNPQGL